MLPVATVGKPYWFQFDTTQGDADEWEWVGDSGVEIPPGLHFDPDTGVVSGIPTKISKVFPYATDLTAYDDAGRASKTIADVVVVSKPVLHYLKGFRGVSIGICREKNGDRVVYFDRSRVKGAVLYQDKFFYSSGGSHVSTNPLRPDEHFQWDVTSKDLKNVVRVRVGGAWGPWTPDLRHVTTTPCGADRPLTRQGGR